MEIILITRRSQMCGIPRGLDTLRDETLKQGKSCLATIESLANRRSFGLRTIRSRGSCVSWYTTQYEYMAVGDFGD